MGATRSDSSLERAAYRIPEFCFRNNISRVTYHRLRAEGRGPVEMRIGINTIRITADAEREWQQQMQEPRRDVERGRPHGYGVDRHCGMPVWDHRRIEPRFP